MIVLQCSGRRLTLSDDAAKCPLHPLPNPSLSLSLSLSYHQSTCCPHPSSTFCQSLTTPHSPPFSSFLSPFPLVALVLLSGGVAECTVSSKGNAVTCHTSTHTHTHSYFIIRSAGILQRHRKKKTLSHRLLLYSRLACNHLFTVPSCTINIVVLLS